MKKLFVAVLAAAMLMFGAVNAYAVVSPMGESNDKPAADKSPKTSDANILLIEGVGIVCLGVAGVAAVRMRKDA